MMNQSKILHYFTTTNEFISTKYKNKNQTTFKSGFIL